MGVFVLYRFETIHLSAVELFVQKYFTKLSQLGPMKTSWGTNFHKYVIKATYFKHSFVVTLEGSEPSVSCVKTISVILSCDKLVRAFR